MNKELTAQDILTYANQQAQPVLIYSDAVEQDMRELKRMKPSIKHRSA